MAREAGLDMPVDEDLDAPASPSVEYLQTGDWAHRLLALEAAAGDEPPRSVAPVPAGPGGAAGAPPGRSPQAAAGTPAPAVTTDGRRSPVVAHRSRRLARSAASRLRTPRGAGSRRSPRGDRGHRPQLRRHLRLPRPVLGDAGRSLRTGAGVRGNRGGDRSRNCGQWLARRGHARDRADAVRRLRHGTERRYAIAVAAARWVVVRAGRRLSGSGTHGVVRAGAPRARGARRGRPRALGRRRRRTERARDSRCARGARDCDGRRFGKAAARHRSRRARAIVNHRPRARAVRRAAGCGRARRRRDRTRRGVRRDRRAVLRPCVTRACGPRAGT